MKDLFLSFAILGAIGLTSCSSEEPAGKSDDNASDNTYERISLSRGEAQVAKVGYDFAWNLFDKANAETPGQNLCFSPTSANIALTMLLNGADGETYSEIAKVLGLEGMNLEEINENSQFLAAELLDRDKNCKLSCANSIWINKTMPVKEAYKSTLSKYFSAKAENTDAVSFANDVNSWCSERTSGLIPKIVDSGTSYDWALLNAIYYQNIWSRSVKFESCGDKDFNNSDGSASTAPFMKGNEIKCNYSESALARHAHVPFGNHAYYMSITVPNEGVAIDQCIEELKNRDAFNNNEQAELTLTMPKFEMKGDYEANDALKALGIERAFDRLSADFSGISDLGTFVDVVKQSYYFKVDEKGATAATATIVGGLVTASPVANPKPMVVDRPFIFTVYEASTNCILFVGKVEKL